MWPVIAGAGVAVLALGEFLGVLSPKKADLLNVKDPFGHGQGGPPPTPTGDAIVDSSALMAYHGYRLTDQGVYKQAQAKLGTTADGYPGTHTMAAIDAYLKAHGAAGVPSWLPVYPWLSAAHGGTGYDGKNAPLAKEWTAGAPMSLLSADGFLSAADKQAHQDALSSGSDTGADPTAAFNQLKQASGAGGMPTTAGDVQSTLIQAGQQAQQAAESTLIQEATGAIKAVV